MGAPTSTRKTEAARDLEVVDDLNGSDGVSGRWLMGWWQVTDLWVSAAGELAWINFFFWVCGLWVL